MVLYCYSITLDCNHSTGSTENFNVALHGLIPTFFNETFYGCCSMLVRNVESWCECEITAGVLPPVLVLRANWDSSSKDGKGVCHATNKGREKKGSVKKFSSVRSETKIPDPSLSP